MKPGAIIELPDGRRGTLTYHNLDGRGGIWGEHDLSHLPEGFDDGWPEPEFMLRDPYPSFAEWHGPDCEAVGEDYVLVGPLDE